MICTATTIKNIAEKHYVYGWSNVDVEDRDLEDSFSVIIIDRDLIENFLDAVFACEDTAEELTVTVYTDAEGIIISGGWEINDWPEEHADLDDILSVLEM